MPDITKQLPNGNAAVIREDGSHIEIDPSGNVINQLNQTPKTQGLFGTHVGENSQALKTARFPSQATEAISKGLMDAYEPESQSVGLNAAARIPQTVASIGADLASKSITPEALITQAALKAVPFLTKPANAVGRFIGEGAENLSGLGYKTPGVLAEVTNNPTLPFKPGVDAANEIYASKVDPSQIRDTLKNILGKKEFVEGAAQAIQDGSITPDEALIARQTLDQIKNQVPRPNFFSLRQAFDEVAKEKFAGADEAYKTGVKADNLRNILPLNKTGSPSIVKSALGIGGLVGGHWSPTAFLTAPAVSPAIQAGAASAVGLGKQAVSAMANNPVPTSIGLAELIQKLKGQK